MHQMETIKDESVHLITLYLCGIEAKYCVPCCCQVAAASGVIQHPVHGCHRIQLRPPGQCDQQGTWYWKRELHNTSIGLNNPDLTIQ